MDTNVADVTVNVAGGLVIDPDAAVIDVVPAATPVARPGVACELLIVATEVFDEVHVGVMAGKWLPSAYVGTAVNCCVNVTATDAVAGVIAIETSGLVTVSVAVPEMLPCAAWMVTVVLGVTAVAKPPCVMVAPAEALHVTLLVRFCVELSAYVPVAVNCWVALGATEAVGGVTAMDTSGLVTVSVAVPEIVPWVAVIVEVALGVMPVAKPPCAVIVAPAVAVQLTAVVMF
jgi:hypothetical protein